MRIVDILQMINLSYTFEFSMKSTLRYIFYQHILGLLELSQIINCFDSKHFPLPVQENLL